MSPYTKRRLLSIAIDAAAVFTLAMGTNDWRLVAGAGVYGIWCFYDGFTRARLVA